MADFVGIRDVRRGGDRVDQGGEVSVAAGLLADFAAGRVVVLAIPECDADGEQAADVGDAAAFCDVRRECVAGMAGAFAREIGGIVLDADYALFCVRALRGI